MMHPDDLKTRQLKIDPQSKVTELEVPDNFDKIMLPTRIMISGPTLSGITRQFSSFLIISVYFLIAYCSFHYAIIQTGSRLEWYF